jgi:hypothetical protein
MFFSTLYLAYVHCKAIKLLVGKLSSSAPAAAVKAAAAKKEEKSELPDKV